MKKKRERDFHDWVASHACGVCGEPGPSMVHHLRAGQGMGQRNHWLCVPLCAECHQGQHGIHGDRNRWVLRKKDELGVLSDLIEKMWENGFP